MSPDYMFSASFLIFLFLHILYFHIFISSTRKDLLKQKFSAICWLVLPEGLVSQEDNREEPVPRVIDTPPKREEVSAHGKKITKEKVEGEMRRWSPLNVLGTLRRGQLRHEEVLGKRKGKGMS